MMKRIGITLLTITLALPLLLMPSGVEAKTLRDLYNEASNAESKANTNKKDLNLTEAQIATINNEVNTIVGEIDSINKEITKKNKEIEELNVKIAKKQEESKNLFRFLQISSGESVYLEYVFGAKDFTDFIYRVSEVEQLTKYNDQVMKEMKQMIEENDKKAKELAAKEKELSAKTTQLNENLSKLGEQKQQQSETQKSLDEDVKNAKQVIDMYKKLGCKMDDNINNCNVVPISTGGFSRPIANGYLTSDYGNRSFNNGKFHYGIDMSSYNQYNTAVYPVADGRVAKILTAASGNTGGNEILVHHVVNGQTYTSDYAHLASINVSQGQAITKNTKLGIMGSTGFSTGPHLHMAISRGRYYLDYYLYSQFINNSVNPRNYISFPSRTYAEWGER